MSQVSLSHEDRVEALRRFGYTEREAAFLCLAALHGGYFLRRQYCQFLGKEAGGTVAALIQKALAYEHAKASTFATQTHVYHLDTRPFYAALGQSDNRNRRNRQPGAIKTRLMGLDFVLAHPQHRYLPSEQDKVEYFTRTRNIDRDLLPTKVYRSKNGTSSTARFFVEKFPIFLRQQPGQDVETEVAFCFVDGGATTVSTFENYLCQYARLFAALAQFQVMFVATRPLLFQPAERAFRRVILARRNGEDPSPAGSLSQRLREYFEARQRYESGQLSTFDRAALIRLRDDRETFSGERFESLFEQWKAFSEGGHPERSEAKTTTPSSISGTFSTCLLEHSYDLFGTLTAF